jgi:hypothetical protein
MLDAVTSIAGQAGSRLNITDDRSPGTRVLSGWVRLRLPEFGGVVTWFVTGFRISSEQIMANGATGQPRRGSGKPRLV